MASLLGITTKRSPVGCYYSIMEPHETSSNTTTPHEASNIEIDADDAITVDEAIMLAQEEHGLTVPKSTLQRWLKQGRIKCVLRVGRYGRNYLIDREDWLAKSFAESEGSRFVYFFFLWLAARQQLPHGSLLGTDSISSNTRSSAKQQQQKQPTKEQCK